MINTWNNMIKEGKQDWINLRGDYKIESEDLKEERTIKSPASWLFTPTLTYIGIKQSIEAGKNLFDKLNPNKEPLFITSATVRTLMTAIYAFYSYKNQYDNAYKNVGKIYVGKIYVVPYINEHLNGAGCCGEPNLDNSNGAIPYDILAQVIDYIVNFVITDENYNYKKMTNTIPTNTIPTKSVNLYQQQSNYSGEMSSLRAVIDTSFYEEAYNNAKKDYSNSNINKFIQVIYPNFKDIIKANTTTNPKQIIAFTHGNFINKEIRKNADLSEDGIVKYNKRKDTMAQATFNNSTKLTRLKNRVNTMSTKITQFSIFDLKQNHTFPNNCSVWPAAILDDDSIKYADKVNEKFDGFIIGGGIRQNNSVLEEEKKSFNMNSNGQILKPSFCSLAVGFLRGNINKLWLQHTLPEVNISKLQNRFGGVSKLNKKFSGGSNTKKNSKKRAKRKTNSIKKTLTKKPVLRKHK